MVLFKKKLKTGEHEVVREGSEDIMHINYEEYQQLPSLEDDALTMSRVVEKLSATPVSRIIFHQKKKYEYSYTQTQMLVEISQIYNHFIKQKKLLSLAALETFGPVQDASLRLKNLQYVILSLLRTDPVGAFVEVKRFLREEKINLEKVKGENEKLTLKPYVDILEELYLLLSKTKLIAQAEQYLPGYVVGSREIYKLLFRATITPDFMLTRLAATPPLDAEEVDSYQIEKNTYAQLFSVKDTIKLLYHLVPPEFQISEDKYELIDLARKVLAEHQPKAEEFIEPEKMRETFFNIGRDLLTELADHKGLEISFEEIEEMAKILVRYTVGFGLIETLLQDPNVQDIAINSPIGNNPIFVVHGTYDECVTNIVPSLDDVESWATKFRLISARPLDEANPVLDTELLIPGARARVAVISKPLNPTGLAFSIRRHRDHPWTLPLFMKNGMMTDLAAGLISFLVDGNRTMLIAGTRGSGKTSVLGSVLVEIMRKYRVVSIEDSVTGDSEILLKRGNRIEKTTIGAWIDSSIERYGCWYDLSDHEILGNDENVQILSKDANHKIVWARPSKLIRHKVDKQVYEVKTRTGRSIKVTEDHSLFVLDDKANFKEIKPKDIQIGEAIATVRTIPFNEKEVLSINLLDYVDRVDTGILCGESLKGFIKENYAQIKQLAKERSYTRSNVPRWLREGSLPIKILKDLNALELPLRVREGLSLKISNTAGTIPLEVRLDEEFLTLVGIWLADGCYDKSSIIFSSFDKEDSELVRRVGERFSLNVKVHSDGGSLMFNSKTLKFIFKEILELRGNAYTKKVPNWIFNLSKEQIGSVLKGIFTGDGCIADKEIVIPLASMQLLRDIQTLLLGFGINLRIGKKRKDGTFNAGISRVQDWMGFREEIGILQGYKNERLEKLCNKKSSHDSTDIIPLSMCLKKTLHDQIKNYKVFNANDYINRDNQLGRKKLGAILEQVQLETKLNENLKNLAKSDIFWDEVSEVVALEKQDVYVYDLSVPEHQNFVCNNILEHNTLELPVDALRDLGYNIQSMKVRSALSSGGNELSAEEGIRTSLRMGDSSLIVGEIRSKEALALYEAMRVGALANVVAGTIHGDSPYGVFDRVVNDLQVPRTSFKATDIILVANPIRSADGLHRARRLTQITEVRKEWESDPLAEKGFVDLMKYDSKSDTLVPTDELINGDSVILKAIGGQIREWAGSWDAIWENILLRAKTKKALLEYSLKTDVPDLIEAEGVVAMNDEFHKISDKIKEEVGFLDSKRIFFEWEESLKRYIKVKYHR